MELAPEPAMTLTRLAAVSTTTRMTSTCSSASSVGDSPVVHRHEAVDAPGDLEFDEFAEPAVVHRAVSLEGGDQCGICALEHE